MIHARSNAFIIHPHIASDDMASASSSPETFDPLVACSGE